MNITSYKIWWSFPFESYLGAIKNLFYRKRNIVYFFAFHSNLVELFKYNRYKVEQSSNIIEIEEFDNLKLELKGALKQFNPNDKTEKKLLKQYFHR